MSLSRRRRNDSDVNVSSARWPRPARRRFEVPIPIMRLTAGSEPISPKLRLVEMPGVTLDTFGSGVNLTPRRGGSTRAETVTNGVAPTGKLQFVKEDRPDQSGMTANIAIDAGRSQRRDCGSESAIIRRIR